MRIPLHQEPDDTSPESARRRLRLYEQAMAINGPGFRVPKFNYVRNPTARNIRRMKLRHGHAETGEIQFKRTFNPSGLEMYLNGLRLQAAFAEPTKRIGALKRLFGQ